jgi:hypothetical protein
MSLNPVSQSVWKNFIMPLVPEVIPDCFFQQNRLKALIHRHLHPGLLWITPPLACSLGESFTFLYSFLTGPEAIPILKCEVYFT